MSRRLSLGAVLLLAAAAAVAQVPGGINRNPVYRESLPPAPPVLPDPRDSSTRPTEPPAQLPTDGRSVLATPPAPQAPASAASPALPGASAPVSNPAVR
ncbi:MAG: hypothetical protein Q8M51_12160 [Polaromonas sp.]|uniref:hypothetical protein n=1 Tax=Polaromonas sp. TaxID=1869339 RepID=UPI002731768F|nr:hypothetical protein [Polaromonas sp.]MDP1742273.1 hypothetical protein [Polaromonas sp.]MDP3356595.1 hypothetical protein [Polaromonas sp.]